MKLGEVCEHGSLKRSCLPCEQSATIDQSMSIIQAADKLKTAADALAEVAKQAMDFCYETAPDGLPYYKYLGRKLKAQLAAYEAIRGKK